MDNLPADKVNGVRGRIEAVGARLLYLPAYSPDFNPIELALAKVKALLRGASAQTIPDLWDAIQRSLTASRQMSVEPTSPLQATTLPDWMPL